MKALILSESELLTLDSVIKEKMLRITGQPNRKQHRFVKSIHKEVQNLLFPVTTFIKKSSI